MKVQIMRFQFLRQRVKVVLVDLPNVPGVFRGNVAVTQWRKSGATGGAGLNNL